MPLDRKLDEWVAAGLLDPEAAARIRAHEAEAGRPLLLWAVTALGLLAFGLGIILLISANWDRIADWLKLAVHLLLLSAALGAVWWGSRRPDRRWAGEAALFLAGVLLLAGQALHAQIYQLTGPVWQLLIAWLLLASPMLLLAGATWLTGVGWALMLLLGLGSMAVELEGEGRWLLLQGLALAGPVLLMALSFVPGVGNAAFRAALRAVGMGTQLAAASLVHLAWASDMAADDARRWAIRLLPAALGAVLALLARRRWPDAMPGPLLLAVLLGPLAAAALALAVPHADHWPSRLAGALVFAAMWGWVALASARAGWGGLFGIAIAAIAVRIFLVYVELFGSLASTGLGLIGGGLLLVALAFGWRRIMRWRAA